MSSTANPEYRLRNLRRQLRDMLMGRRLAADPERTGVVDLSDFGKRCDALADFAAQSAEELRTGRGEEARCAAVIAEEIELAARAAALLEGLPRSPQRVGRQCDLLEESAARLEAALAADLLLVEQPEPVRLASLARREKELFDPFVEFEGRIEAGPPSHLPAGPVRRALRRALLEHEGGPFRLSVDRDGKLRFPGAEHGGAPPGVGLTRTAHEPPEVKKALDLREAAPDPALADFLLVKAVDEALFALLSPRLQGTEWSERARALPRRPGKRMAVRPEAVRLEIAGWDLQEAARAVEKLAARRAGPEWARLPKGAYLLRLFLVEEDALTADLLALGPVLRRMEKGVEVEGAAERAERALRGLLALLG